MGAGVMNVQERPFAEIAYSKLPVSEASSGLSNVAVVQLDQVPLSMAEGWKLARERLLTLWNLEPNWDDEGAPSPDKSILSGALRLAETQRRGWQSEQTEAKLVDGRPTRLLPPPNRISPSQHGTILFEWQWPGVYFEVEIISPNAAECMLMTEGSKAIHFLYPYHW
jgi:hypothetical protein